jgi:hypothetical protein
MANRESGKQRQLFSFTRKHGEATDVLVVQSLGAVASNRSD